MNIAMFTDAYLPRMNGIAISVYSYALELTKIGHKVCVVCLEYSEKQQKFFFWDQKKEDLKTPFKVLRIPSTRLIWSKDERLGRLDKWNFLKKEMDKFKPNIVHINTELVAGYFGVVYALHRHIPYVFTFHTLWEDCLSNYASFLSEKSSKKIGRCVSKFYLKRSSAIIAPTECVADIIRRYGIEKNVEILPASVSSGFFKYSFSKDLQIRSQLFPHNSSLIGKKIILFVGRISKEKNLCFLLDVLEKVLQKSPMTALMFVGSGPYLDELKKIVRERNLSKSVIFTGHSAHQDLIYYYKYSTVFVFPSLTDTQGTVTVEAMSTGLPVVAIGQMGTLDIMRGDNGGFMVNNNVQEFAGRVVSLLNDPNLRRKKADEAIEWAKQWSIENLAPKLVECYRRVLDTGCKNLFGNSSKFRKNASK